MPYDLANIGLEGQQAYYTRLATAAQAESMQASAAKNNFDLEQEQRMQSLSDEAAAKMTSILNRDKSGSGDLLQDPGDDQAGVLQQLGDIFIKGGAPKAGMEFLKGASEIQNQQSQIEGRTAEMAQKRLENIQKGAQIAGQKLGKARNQAEWDQGLREVEAAGIIEPHLMEQLKGMPYDPDVAAYFYDQSVTAAEQARIDLQKHTQDRLARQDQVRNSQAQRNEAIQRARLKDTQRRTEIMEKNAGKNGGRIPANSDLVKTASAVLKDSDLYKGREYDTNNFKAATSYIASQAQQIIRGNKAIDMNTAVQQAVIQARQSGAFEQFKTYDETLGIKHNEKHTTEFKSDGLQPETARPLPPGLKSAADAAKALKKGQWYNTTRGPAKWNGSAWEQ